MNTTKSERRDGKTLAFPGGYASAEDYLETLRLNLKIAESRPRMAGFVPKIKASIAEAEAFLAK